MSQQPLADVQAQMRADWNARAQEDAYYYVAFGRRDQDDAEFDATAEEVVKGLQHELRRTPTTKPRARRALEIGCGPGRLLKPMSRLFGEVHGVDVADGMVAKAKERLAGIPHAHAHVGSGSDLAQFADESFDFVYSYAVFQHIPSGEVVFSYLREAVRVLKPGGLIRVQVNGLPKTAKVYDTWSGVRISTGEIHEFCRQQGVQLLALEGRDTQYMWTTWRKLPAAPVAAAARIAIRRLTNAFSSEPVAPPTGRFSSVSAWVDGLPDHADLNNLTLTVAGQPAALTYLGRREPDGLQQLAAILPRGLQTGQVPVTLSMEGQADSPHVRFRIIPAPPPVPRILTVSDGINLMSGHRIRSGSVKLQIEEFHDLEKMEVTFGGRRIGHLDFFCTDPMPPAHEVNFQIPSYRDLPPGSYPLEVRVGSRRFARVVLDLVR
jgi:ubiquinone/menaquinone biosynthesis C-methylase UbiE